METENKRPSSEYQNNVLTVSSFVQGKNSNMVVGDAKSMKTGQRSVSITPTKEKEEIKTVPGFKKMVQELPDNKEKAIRCFAEVIGTAMLVFFGCMSCVDKIQPGGIPNHLNICLSFGLTVMFVVQIFGHISGSHINPAVTIAAVIFGDLPILLAPLYFVSQTIGALLGFLILKSVTPAEYLPTAYMKFDPITNSTITIHGVCTTVPQPYLYGYQAMLVEFFATGALILVCCGVWDNRNLNKHDSVTLRFGFTIAVLALITGPYTGCSMNPVRSLAPAVFNNDWQQHWVYWLGPISAAFVFTTLYRYIFVKPLPPKPDEVEGVPLTTNPGAKYHA